MRKIKWWCETGFAGDVHEGEVELSDDYTDDEISDYVYDEVMNYISWGWKNAEEDEDEDN